MGRNLQDEGGKGNEEGNERRATTTALPAVPARFALRADQTVEGERDGSGPEAEDDRLRQFAAALGAMAGFETVRDVAPAKEGKGRSSRSTPSPGASRWRATRAASSGAVIATLAIATALIGSGEAAIGSPMRRAIIGRTISGAAASGGSTTRHRMMAPRKRLRKHRRGRRVALHLALVRRGVLSAEGTVRGTRNFRRALVQVRHGRRWTAVRRAVPIRRHGRFSLRWHIKASTSRVAVRVIALGKRRRRSVSRVTRLRIAGRGSAAFSVPATTRVYAGEAVRSASAGPHGETIVRLAPGSGKPLAGGHAALAPSAALPFGMFASVVRASRKGRGWIVVLKRAPIDEVFDNVSLHFDQDVTPHLVNAAGQPMASSARSSRALRISGRASFAHSAGLGSVFECKSAGKPEAPDHAFASTAPMPLSIELSNLHALDDFDAGSFFPHRNPFFLMQVHGQAKASVGFEAKNAFSCELSDSFRENHRIAVPLGAVGPVPVTMYLEPTLKFEVSESGSVSLSQRHYWAITLEQNGFSPFSARLAHSADPVELNANAALGASLFAGGDLSVMFGAGEGSWAAQAGIYGAFGPDFELAASTDRPGCLTATAKLMADLGVRLQVLVKRWHLQLASLTSKPADLGGPWCVGGKGTSGDSGGESADGSGGAAGESEGGSEETESSGGAGEGPVHVVISGTGSGEIYSLPMAEEEPRPLIACSYIPPGPQTGACEAEPGKEGGFEGIVLEHKAASGSEFAGWKVPKGVAICEVEDPGAGSCSALTFGGEIVIEAMFTAEPAS